MLKHVQRVILAVLFVGGLAATAHADTIYVCWDGSGDYLTIQEGIDAAEDGDEVVVCDGTYTGPLNKNLDFGGRLLTVRSENGPDNCIIDCEDDGRGFYFHSGETAQAVVQGLTIRNGYVDEGSPGGARGGAVYCKQSSAPTLTNCTIAANRAGVWGGGVCCYDNSNATLTNCTISGNTAGNSGGGVCCWDNVSSSPTLTNCTIAGNTAACGGGALCYTSSPTLTNCTITGNTSGGCGGGGIACYYSSPSLTGCTITDNTTSGNGGGVYCRQYSSPTATNCTMAANWAGNSGAGMYCERHSSPTATNCTIAANWATNGRALACDDPDRPSTVLMVNCILWNGGDEIWNDGSIIEIRYSDVAGGWPGLGNIDADPLFVTGPRGEYYLSQTAAGQPADSPCVDAGSDTAENLGLDTRTTRTDQVPDSGIVDMGYHYPIVCLGDLDGDGDTDHSDLGELLAAWCTQAGDPNWNPDADLDGDGHVGHGDLGILLADWGCGT